ncbi:MAG: transposase, partial [Bacilli bacterium]|nr:transposase [Bacilli bacterium]
SLTIYNLNLEIKKLNKTILEKDKKIEKLLEEIDRLKNKNNKNSSNSSKPSSTNMTTPKKKTGSNIYNYRVKTGKKCGGQYGHIGHSLSKRYVEELIDKKKIEVREFTHIIKGKSSKENTIKYKLGIEIKPYAEKHIFKYDKNSIDILSAEYYTDVTYDNSIKALSIELGAYNVISYDRLSDFFNVITDGIIQISKGNLVNILYEFSNKCEPTLEILEDEILNNKYTYTDETGTKFNGKNMYVRNYSNENTVIYKAHKNKGHNPIKEDNILTRFCGGIMGDHDTTLQKYGTKNYECNIHVGRYLEELIQNIKDITWPIKMKDLMFRMNNTRKIAISFGLKKFNKEKIDEYIKEFDNLLKLAMEENKSIKSSYYKDKT